MTGAKGIIKVELWRLVLPVLWIGMVGAISFIEAPLKFQAPDITIPLGLGIGRLVFGALNIVEAITLIALLVISFLPRIARIRGTRLNFLIALTVVFIAKVAVVRPPLNARTDQVLSGANPGDSPWHYIYIACEVANLALLVILAVLTARAIVARVTALTSDGPR
ncbi:MAG: hypothetical protein ACTHW3_04880 [Leucobacter sp.]